MGISPFQRDFSVPLLLAMQGGRCFWRHCQRPCVIARSPSLPDNAATLEHLVPKSWGGGNNYLNLAVSCYRCNNNRSDSMAGEWAVVVLPQMLNYSKIATRFIGPGPEPQIGPIGEKLMEMNAETRKFFGMMSAPQRRRWLLERRVMESHNA